MMMKANSTLWRRVSMTLRHRGIRFYSYRLHCALAWRVSPGVVVSDLADRLASMADEAAFEMDVYEMNSSDVIVFTQKLK